MVTDLDTAMDTAMRNSNGHLVKRAYSVLNKHANFILMSRFIELIKEMMMNTGMVIYVSQCRSHRAKFVFESKTCEMYAKCNFSYSNFKLHHMDE